MEVEGKGKAEYDFDVAQYRGDWVAGDTINPDARTWNMMGSLLGSAPTKG